MADVELTYKGTTIGSLSNTGTLTMETAGKYCEANIGLTYTKSGGGGGTDVSDTTATAGDVLSGTWFHIADGSYVQGTIPTNTSEDVTVSGKTVTVDSGYYATAVSKSVADGSATTPATTISVTPSVTVDSSTGVVTASVSGSQSVTPTVSAGYVSSGTAGQVSVSGSNTLSLSTAQGGTITPTESQQTAVAAGKYTLGAVTVDAISSTYVGSGIDRNDSTDLTVSGATVTAPAGYYASDASKSVATGVVTAPSVITASGATVTASFPDSFSLSTFNPVSVTPVVSTPGYVTSGTAGSTSITLSTTSIAVKSANTYTPGAVDQTIAAGTYLNGAQTISGDSNLTAANIKDGTSIFGVTGTFTDASTVSSGQTAATASQILSGYSAWVDGVEVQGSASGGGDTFAFIAVTFPAVTSPVPAGAYCTATATGRTPISAPNDALLAGSYVFDIPTPSGASETWTISCSNGTDTATSEPITISTKGQRVEVSLGYEVWFVKNGYAIPSISSFGKAGYDANVQENYNGSGALRVYSANVSGSRCTMYYIDKVTFPSGNYNYLCCEHQVRGYANANMGSYGVLDGIPANASATPNYIEFNHLITSSQNTLTPKETTYVDVSGVSGQYYIAFSEGGTGTANGEFLCYNLWLSKTIPNT